MSAAASGEPDGLRSRAAFGGLTREEYVEKMQLVYKQLNRNRDITCQAADFDYCMRYATRYSMRNGFRYDFIYRTRLDLFHPVPFVWRRLYYWANGLPFDYQTRGSDGDTWVTRPQWNYSDPHMRVVPRNQNGDGRVKLFLRDKVVFQMKI